MRSWFCFFVFAGLAVHTAGLCVSAEERRWIDPAGGDFSDSLNWEGENVPGPDDDALFSVPSDAGYTVTLDIDAENAAVRVDDVDVTLDLNGHTYTCDELRHPGGSLHSTFTLEGPGHLTAAATDMESGLRVAGGAQYDVTVGDSSQWLWGYGVTVEGSGSRFIYPFGVSADCWGSSADAVAVLDGGYLYTETVDISGPARVSGSGSLWQAESMHISYTQLLISDGAAVQVAGEFSGGRFSDTTVELQLAGGTLEAATIDLRRFADVGGHGTLAGKIIGDARTVIEASGGDLVLGDPERVDSLAFDGTMRVGDHTISIEALSCAKLGHFTEVAGGTLRAENGMALPTGSSLAGTGTVEGRLAAALGSTVQVTGPLSLGDADAYDGFFSDGSLLVGANTVTLHDRNEAVLGSLTRLGTDTADGTLVADNGLLVEFGKNLVGRGTVQTPDDAATPFINNGDVVGDGPEHPLVLTGYVKGVGDFDNVTFEGTHSPGLSTTSQEVGRVAYTGGSTLVMELGGKQPGSEHDQVVSEEAVTLGGTLAVVMLDSFRPAHNDTFQVMTFASCGGTTFNAHQGTDLGDRLTLVPTYGNTDLVLTAVQGGPGQWAVDAGGAASVPANWSAGLPNGPGDVATFGQTITAAREVTVDAPTTLGGIVFDSPEAYTLAGPHALTLDAETGLAAVEVTGEAAVHTIAAEVVLADALAIDVAALGTLVFDAAGLLDNGAGHTITKTGAGTLRIDGLQGHGRGAVIEVLAGTVEMNSDASGTGLMGDADLSIVVTDAELQFGWNQHLDTLEIGDGGLVRFTGADVVVVRHLVMDGVDLGAMALTPEPATLALAVLGAVGILLRRRRR